MQTKVLNAAKGLGLETAQKPFSSYGGMTYLDALIHIATTTSQFQIAKRLRQDHRDLGVMKAHSLNMEGF